LIAALSAQPEELAVHFKHIRRPRTRRGWLITIAAGGAVLALKLTLGLGILALVVHLLTH
jgi:hypothetical protein